MGMIKEAGAIQLLQMRKRDCSDTLREAIDVAIDELERNVPADKVAMIDDCYGICECGNLVCKNANYCSGCGQRLKW